MAPEKNESRTVLVTRFSAIGDVAMTIPTVYAAARANPGTRFVVVTRSRLAPIWINPPANVTVEGVDLSQYKGLAGIRRLTRRLIEKYRPAAMADLHDVLRTKVMRLTARMAGLRVAHIDKGRADKRRLTRLGAVAGPQLQPMASRYRDVFHRLGIIVGPTDDALTIPASIDLPIELPRECPLIGIAPFAAHPGKIYPLDKLKEVVRLIVKERPEARIYFFGGGDEESRQIAALTEMFAPVATSVAALHLGFAAEMALMSRLDVMLTMDSSNMHLARLAGTRVVSVWGATHPAAGFCPQGVQVIQRASLECRPCSVYGDRPCRLGHPSCLDIDPHSIANQILSQINRK